MRRVEDFRPDVIEFSFLTIEYKLTRMFQEQFADLCPGATVIGGGAPVRVLSHPHCRPTLQSCPAEPLVIMRKKQENAAIHLTEI